MDVIIANLEKSATSIAVLAIRRTERDGLVDSVAWDRMELIVPHVRRAILIGKVIDWNKLEATALTAAMDRLAAAVFLLDGGGRIVYVNAAGRAVLDRGSLLRALNGTLTANDPEADKTLRETFAAAGGGDAAVGIKAVAVPLTTADGERYIGHALPLTSGARRQAGLSTTAAAALFVRKAGLDLPSPIEILAKLYKLTAGELGVLQAVVEAGSVPAAAKVLGVSQTTVKTHLHHVFQKTGAKRQIDLAKLVAGAASPFAE